MSWTKTYTLDIVKNNAQGFESSIPQKETLTDLKKEGKHYLLSLFDFIFLSVRSKYKKSPLEFFALFLGGFLLSVLCSAFILLVLFQKIDINFSVPTYSFGNIGFLSFTQSGKTVPSAKTDPVVLLGMIMKNNLDYVLIDVRSAAEFDSGHIKTAVSVPVYGTNFIRADGSIEKNGLRDMFNKATKGKRKIILYGQSQYSTYPETVIKALGLRNAEVLSVGWNEWMHFKNLWLPEDQWNKVNIRDYVQVQEE